jgi:hypothetical protein
MTETQMPEKAQLKINDAEFCFQFNEEEPVVFAWAEGPLENPLGSPHKFSFEMEALEGANIVFSDGAKTFKIFARPISEQSAELREQQKNGNNN